MKRKESDLQKQVNEYLDWINIKHIHLQTAITRIIKCPFCQQFFKKTYSVEKNKGVLDHIIFFPGGKLLLVEYKIGKNKLTKEQIEWYEYLKNKKYEVLIIQKFETIKMIIDYYKKNEKR